MGVAMQINDGQIEANRDNTWILKYPNDMLNGVIVDLDENYAFISAHEGREGYGALVQGLLDEGVEVVEIASDVDLTCPPHAWVVQSLVRAVQRGAEELVHG